MDSVTKPVNLSRLLSLLRVHGFLLENSCVVNTTKWPVYSYGTPGTLLRTNLKQEWWDYMVVKQENSFPVTTSIISPCCLSNQDTPASEKKQAFAYENDLLSHYLGTLQLMGGRLPFTIAQMGTCINELYDEKSEEKLLFGGLFNTEMINHYYCLPAVSSLAFDNWLSFRLRWWKQFARNPSNFTTVDNSDHCNGNISSRIEYLFPWGPEPIEIVTNEGETLFKEKESEMSYRVKSGRKDVLPHLIECRMYLESAMAVYLVDAFQEKQVFTANSKTGKEKEPRQVLHLHRHLAPYKVAMTTSGTKSRELKSVATRWCEDLRDSTIMVLDTSDANSTLEMQFIRNDALGIPYTVILNDKTLDTGVTGLRGRDTALKEQVHLTKIKDFIIKHIDPV